MRRHVRPLRLLLLVFVTVLTAPTIASSVDLPFHNPPETSSIIPEGAWVSPYPYQRNIMIPIEFDPRAALHDANVPEAFELSQLAETCLWAGWDDQALHDPDWYDLDANSEHYYTETFDIPGGPVGLIGIGFDPISEVTFTLYLNNDPIEHELKNVWLEFEYYTRGEGEISITPLPDVPAKTVEANHAHEYLGEIWDMTWHRMNIWWQMTPNPTGEKLIFTLSSPELNQGVMLIDYIHIATESVDPVCHEADANCDGSIDMGELISYIECWYRGDCPLDKLFQAIELWFSGV